MSRGQRHICAPPTEVRMELRRTYSCSLRSSSVMIRQGRFSPVDRLDLKVGRARRRGPDGAATYLPATFPATSRSRRLQQDARTVWYLRPVVQCARLPVVPQPRRNAFEGTSRKGSIYDEASVPSVKSVRQLARLRLDFPLKLLYRELFPSLWRELDHRQLAVFHSNLVAAQSDGFFALHG